MALWSDVVFYRRSPVPPDSGAAEVVRPAWKSPPAPAHAADIYEVNRRWNARVDSAPEGRKFSLREYVSYVLNVYEELATLEAALGADEVARIEAAWPNLPRTSESLDAAAQSESGALWLGYLRRARQIVDHCYPGFNPNVTRC
jgi:hypothetical protein